MITIHPWKGKRKALDIVKELKRLNVRKVRVNLKTSYRQEHLDEFFSFINEASDLNENIIWYFDVGIPGDTLRLVIPAKPYNFNITRGESVRIFTNNRDNYDNEKRMYLRKPCIPCDIATLFSEGESFLYGDGEIEFEIKNVGEGYFEAIALNSGTIWDGKAIYPQQKIITCYDSMLSIMQYIDTIKRKNENHLICSMVEHPEQLAPIREISRMMIISKIETECGIKQLDSIAKESDGIMLGRGDLLMGAHGYKHYWELQQLFMDYISKHQELNSIIATDLLDSFKDNRLPTRSDLTDLFYLLKYHPKVLCLSASAFYSNNLEHCIALIRSV